MKSSGVWYVQGIFSAYAIDDDGGCDWSNYGVFTKVDAFYNWIEDIKKQFPESFSVKSLSTSTISSTMPTTDIYIPRVFSSPHPFRTFRTNLQCTYQPMKVVHRPDVGDV